MDRLTAAQNQVPFGTLIRVTNLRNGLSTIVRVNDRGLLSDGRIIDLSYGAARKLGMVSSGVERVQLEILAASPTPSDDVPKSSKR